MASFSSLGTLPATNVSILLLLLVRELHWEWGPPPRSLPQLECPTLTLHPHLCGLSSATPNVLIATSQQAFSDIPWMSTPSPRPLLELHLQRLFICGELFLSYLKSSSLSLSSCVARINSNEVKQTHEGVIYGIDSQGGRCEGRRESCLGAGRGRCFWQLTILTVAPAGCY